MPNEIVWIGSDNIRSLLVKTGSETKFYLPGQVVPDGLLAPDILERHVASGRIKVKSVACRVSDIPATAPDVQIKQQSFEVPQPTANKHSIAVPADQILKDVESNESPDSATRRTRTSSKRKKS